MHHHFHFKYIHLQIYANRIEKTGSNLSLSICIYVIGTQALGVKRSLYSNTSQIPTSDILFYVLSIFKRRQEKGINPKYKTENIVISGRKSRTCKLQSGDVIMKQLQKFKHLGIVLSENGEHDSKN